MLFAIRQWMQLKVQDFTKLRESTPTSFQKIFGTKIAIPLLSEIATLLIIKGKMNRTKPLVYKESSRKINSFSHETNGIYKNLKNKILQTA